jgi:peptide/nickel transport system substrate-binding protein
MFRTDAYEGGFNYMKYSNPEFDRLDDLQRVEFDAEKRRELLIQQSNIVNEDLPVGILVFRDQRVAFSDRLHNFFPTTVGSNEYWSLGYTWVEES